MHAHPIRSQIYHQQHLFQHAFSSNQISNLPPATSISACILIQSDLKFTTSNIYFSMHSHPIRSQIYHQQHLFQHACSSNQISNLPPATSISACMLIQSDLKFTTSNIYFSMHSHPIRSQIYHQQHLFQHAFSSNQISNLPPATSISACILIQSDLKFTTSNIYFSMHSHPIRSQIYHQQHLFQHACSSNQISNLPPATSISACILIQSDLKFTTSNIYFSMHAHPIRSQIYHQQHLFQHACSSNQISNLPPATSISACMLIQSDLKFTTSNIYFSMHAHPIRSQIYHQQHLFQHACSSNQISNLPPATSISACMLIQSDLKFTTSNIYFSMHAHPIRSQIYHQQHLFQHACSSNQISNLPPATSISACMLIQSDLKFTTSNIYFSMHAHPIRSQIYHQQHLFQHACS